MAKIPHKFLTTAGILVIMIIGVLLATKFENINVNLAPTNTALLLVNSLLSLIILGILLSPKGNITETSKKRAERNV